MGPSTDTTSLVMRNPSSGPRRAASQKHRSDARPLIGLAHGDGTYVTASVKSPSSAAVPGARQAYSYRPSQSCTTARSVIASSSRPGTSVPSCGEVLVVGRRPGAAPLPSDGGEGGDDDVAGSDHAGLLDRSIEVRDQRGVLDPRVEHVRVDARVDV